MKLKPISVQDCAESDGVTYLYDITVEEDHSFIIEGLVSHNCTFEFENKELDDLAQAFGHTQIGVPGDEPTEQTEFTLYPDEKSLKGGHGSGSWDGPGQPRFAYHGTEPKNIKNILKNGLLISKDKEDWRKVVFVADKFSSAQAFGMGEREKGKYAVLTIDPDKIDSFTNIGEFSVSDKNIPASAIVKAEIFKFSSQEQDLSKHTLVETINNKSYKKSESDYVYVAIRLDDEESKSLKGGQGSGNFGHQGRPGLVGGSGGAGSPEGSETSEVTSGTKFKDWNEFDAEVEKLTQKFGYMGAVARSEETKVFELNGKAHYYAGSANLQTGEITLYMNHLTKESLPGVLAHEIQHIQYQDVMDRYTQERDAMIQAYKETGEDNERADGRIRPEYADKYPVYAALNDTQGMQFTELINNDGVTPYSRMWWDEWHAGKAKTDQAFHETMAEMSRIKLETGKLPGAKVWKDYFKATQKVYKEQQLWK